MLVQPIAAARRHQVEVVGRSQTAFAGAVGGKDEKLRALDPLYDEQARAMSLPYGQFQQAYAPMLARMKAGPAYPLVPADFSRVYQQNAYARARMSLFRAAIVIVRDGADAAKAAKDPFGDGPFTYRAVPGGFELNSRLQGKDGQPLTLKVGNPKAN